MGLIIIFISLMHGSRKRNIGVDSAV